MKKTEPIVASVCTSERQQPDQQDPHDVARRRQTDWPTDLPTLIAVVELCEELDTLVVQYAHDGRRQVLSSVAEGRWWARGQNPMALRRGLSEAETYGVQQALCLFEFYCLAFFRVTWGEMFTEVPYRLQYINKLTGEGEMWRFYMAIAYIFGLHKRMLQYSRLVLWWEVRDEAYLVESEGRPFRHTDILGFFLRTAEEDHRYLRFMTSCGIRGAVKYLQKSGLKQAWSIARQVKLSGWYPNSHTRMLFPLPERELLDPGSDGMLAWATTLPYQHPSFSGQAILEPPWFGNWGWLQILYRQSPWEIFGLYEESLWKPWDEPNGSETTDGIPTPDTASSWCGTAEGWTSEIDRPL